MNKILIIDDNQVNRDLLQDILSPIYQIIIAKDGFQGIQLALEHKPILIICDIMMPKMDGYEVLKKVRESSELSTVPFIFLTAKAEKTDFRIGMDCGADDYLTKPFTSDELITAVESRLKRKDEIDKDLKNKVKEIYTTLNTTSSHEFNTPLNAIIGFTSLLISNFNRFSKDEIIRMLETIKSSSKRLYRTTNNIILHTYIQKFSENENNYPQGETSNSEITITNTINSISDFCGRKDSIVMDIHNASLQINESDLSKIIEEIVHNSLSYSNSDQKVYITTNIDSSLYIIKIKDFGRGFKKEDIENIGPYMQFNRNQFEQQGMGLGLYIAKRLTTLNKGTFSLKSKENEGTEIILAFSLKN